MIHPSLHPQLLADCHRLGRFARCQVLLHKNAGVPWFILVPETDETDLLRLAPPLQAEVMAECAAVAEYIREELGWEKINFGAIGNQVPQLHLHVIGRRADDPCWPRPVWGNLAAGASYTRQQVDAMQSQLAARGSGAFMRPRFAIDRG